LKNVFVTTSARSQMSDTLASSNPCWSNSAIAASMIRARTSRFRRSRRRGFSASATTVAIGAEYYPRYSRMQDYTRM
jgi:hypothetical protein